MTKKINWGIIGLGKIAHKFASDLQLSATAQLAGVASRDAGKAREFADKYNAHRAYGSYAELARDPSIDVVYIATPHVFHYENTMMCLQNGKSVLCEKPMGMNKDEVEIMVREAKARKLFLMEGIWTRFIPATEKLIGLLEDKVIGDLLFIRADFGFRASYNPDGRLFNKELGGGSLLDIGIYPIYLGLLTLGIPVEIKAVARKAPTGVDSYCSMMFDYKDGAKASLEATFEADTPTEAYIYGSKGHIKVHRRFHHPEKLTVFQNGGKEEKHEMAYRGNGYIHEIEEVNQCLLSHQSESKKLPLQTSIDLVTIIDRTRNEIGQGHAG